MDGNIVVTGEVGGYVIRFSSIDSLFGLPDGTINNTNVIIWANLVNGGSVGSIDTVGLTYDRSSATYANCLIIYMG